jgi:DNA polymerase-4
VVVPPRISRYAQVSKSVMAIFDRYSPEVEPLSLDEAFLDVTGTEALFGAPVEVGWKVQHDIKAELHLSCSVGVATNKYVAKVASDLKKPGGLVVVPPGEERLFLEPLPLERLWGVGPKTAERLHTLGLVTIGDVARLGDDDLMLRLGALGAQIVRLARGEDERPVKHERERKSLGAERTLEADIEGAPAVRAALLPLVDEVAAALRKESLRAGGVRLKLKYADFHRVSRELRLREAVADGGSLLAAIDELLPRVDTARPMRLVGIACTALVAEAAPRQPSLFSAAGPSDGAPDAQRGERLGRAMDDIHQRFGGSALRRGETAVRADGSLGEQEQRDATHPRARRAAAPPPSDEDTE